MKLAEIQSTPYTVTSQPDTPILVKLFIKHANAGTLHIELVERGEHVYGGRAWTSAEDAPNGIMTFRVDAARGDRIITIDLDDTESYTYDLRVERGTVWLYVTVYE